MRCVTVLLLTGLAGCAATQAQEPAAIGRGRFYVERRTVGRALGAGSAFCAARGQPFVAGKIEKQTSNHPASVTFTCG